MIRSSCGGVVVVLSLAMAIGCGGDDTGGQEQTLTVVATSPLDGQADVPVGLGAVTVTFDQALDPSAVLGLAEGAIALDGTLAVTGDTISFVPTTGLRFGATYVGSVAAGTRAASGSTLPTAYTWSFTVQPDVARQVFVTSVSGTEQFDTWADAGGATGLAAADAICQARATAAGLDGTFRAWVSDDTDSAVCRIVGLAGHPGDAACGGATLPTAGPWLRTDGEPVAASAVELTSRVRGDVRVPIVLDEHGRRRATTVWTNTESTGRAAGDLLTGASVGTTYAWTAYDSSADAGTTGALYCFEGGAGPALVDTPVTGRRMFLSSPASSGDLGSHPRAGGATGLAAGDAICRSLATEAGLPGADQFVAWLSDGTSSAASRVTADGPWYRLDGVLVAASKEELVSGTLRTSPNQRIDGIYLAWSRTIGNAVWTGTTPSGTSASTHCSDWSGGGSGTLGRPAITDDRWTLEISASCSLGAPVYCIQN